MKSRENISVVWLKRDLRLHDNEAIYNALNSGNRVLLLYVFEDILLKDPHYSERHWNFIKQSIQDINEDLKAFNTQVFVVNGNLLAIFNQLQNFFNIENVFSHQETGLQVTYSRDKEFKRFCRNNQINRVENINNGVLRGLLNRDDWFEKWETYMKLPQIEFNARSNQFVSQEELNKLNDYFKITEVTSDENLNFQQGGRKMAWRYADSFFENRHKQYMFKISKPEDSRKSCSRLSPYISWGNVSIREIYQRAQYVKAQTSHKKHLGAFISRLRWQAHFIQKFEMEHTMENASVNKGYHKLKKSISERYILAWETGQTGFPLVDAAMRCLITTGYINFRMRAMLVSFFTHILWQPWQSATHHLSKNFLDFEPGIHFPQLQMQAGETGINNLRIYNPTRNGLDHDPDAVFIKKWVPELANLPVPFIHEPYRMTELDQLFNNFELGVDYPKPIVDIGKNRKRATDVLWKMKEAPEVKVESVRILRKHTLNDRDKMLRDE